MIACFAETGDFKSIPVYAKRVGYQADYTYLLQYVLRLDPTKGAEFAKMIYADESWPLVPLDTIVDVFASLNLVQQATAFLLDALKDNKPEHAHLQTRLLEMNLMVIRASNN